MAQKLLFFLLLGLCIRLILVPFPGFEGDLGFWRSWSTVAAEKGVVWLAQNTDYNYPAGFTLVLWLMGKTYQALSGLFGSASNYLFLLLAKLPSIIADLIITVVIYHLISKRSEIFSIPKAKSKKLALIASLLYFFNPFVIYDGAWWGQVDSFGVLFLFLSFWALAESHPVIASAILTLGVFQKMQNIVFLPLFLFYIWQSFSWKEMVKALATAFITFLVVTLPFFLAQSLSRTFVLFTQNSDWFPYLSLRAYNFWWLLTKGNWQSSDKILTWGILSARTLGMILFSASYLAATGLILRRKTLKSFFLANTFLAFAFFMLPTQSHERYSFYALSLTVLLLPELFLISKKFFYHFLFFSLTCLVNLNNSLIFFYPKNGLPFFSVFFRPEVETLLSLINSLLFLIICFLIIRKLPLIITVCIATIVLGGVFFLNLPYLLGQQISLTKLKPLSISQDYGLLQKNRNLASMAGPKNWGFLSVNHYFYRRGFATHANSRIVFDLKKRFKVFTTDMGIDSDGGEQASVVFEIYGDEKLLYRSKTVKKYDLPIRKEVDISDVKQLVLVVNDAGDGINGDHADWLDPLLIK